MQVETKVETDDERLRTGAILAVRETDTCDFYVVVNYSQRADVNYGLGGPIPPTTHVAVRRLELGETDVLDTKTFNRSHLVESGPSVETHAWQS